MFIISVYKIKIQRKENTKWKKYGKISPIMNGLYQVSNLGRVKIFPRSGTPAKEIRITSGNLNSFTGYLRISLSKHNKYKSFPVHRLVAMAFLNKNDFKHLKTEDRSKIDMNNLQINHKDKNRKNNCVSNLEWCTPAYNTFHKIEFKVIECIETGVIYSNKYEASKDTGTHPTCIVNTCAGRQKTAGGYHWKYV